MHYTAHRNSTQQFAFETTRQHSQKLENTEQQRIENTLKNEVHRAKANTQAGSIQMACACYTNSLSSNMAYYRVEHNSYYWQQQLSNGDTKMAACNHNSHQNLYAKPAKNITQSMATFPR